MKTQSKELIEEEKYTLDSHKREKKELENKWVKLPSTLRYIEFLKHYIEEKEKFIQSLKDYKPKK